ncbi:MAG: M24 family metallopeptidase [Calditrichia bacterium]
MNLQKIQQALREHDVDGWLLYDFHNRDPIAMHILGLDPEKFSSRRWYYFIPTEGEPVKLVSKVEATVLDFLPGKKAPYLSWKEMHRKIKETLGSRKRIAMNYSTSMVDGGTVELIKSFGYELVSAADLIQQFEAVLDDSQIATHAHAGEIVLKIKDEAFAKIGKAVSEGREVTEYEIQQFIMKRFEEEGLTCDGHGPIVGVNEHPANPHFEPTAENARVFKKGDTILIDLWARKDEPGSIYYDVTWCAYAGDNPPDKYKEIFQTVCNARDAAKNLVEEKFASGEACYGWEVDDVCRNVIKEAGYGDYFIHRTGHSIGTEVHGNGVNIDNLETKDERRLIPGVCFSIEPGIYLEGEMAVRTEINICITPDGQVKVFGDIQQDLILLD